MNTLERLKRVKEKEKVDTLMEINQKLKTPDERHDMGFLSVINAQIELEWVIKDLENLY